MFQLQLISVILGFHFYEIHALNCWGGNQLLTLGASTLGSSSGCPSNGDTCKSVTSYSSGFPNFPVTQVSCVQQNTDTTNGCSSCSSYPCSFSVINNLTGVVQNIYCNSLTDSNKPQVTSCYTGTLSARYQPIGVCSSTNIFCKLDTTLPTSPVGSCTDACDSSLPNTKCCNTNNCNNVLTCKVGSFIGFFTPSTLCSATDKYCQTVYINGVSHGACASTCIASVTGSTYCCSTPDCNSSYRLKFNMIPIIFLFFFNF